jgi:hypothetical protein
MGVDSAFGKCAAVTVVIVVSISSLSVVEDCVGLIIRASKSTYRRGQAQTNSWHELLDSV